MEQASRLLVQRDYFETERVCLQALRRAMAINDFDRVARIVLPLQEARRQRREMAVDSGAVFLVEDGPAPERVLPGCYLFAPPRVGVEGRNLREVADKARVPVVVVVREPVTKDGLWPLVAVGGCTVRTKVTPPTAWRPPAPEVRAPTKKTSGKRGKSVAAESGASGGGGASEAGEHGAAAIPVVLPPPEWFVTAVEQLGDAAIETALAQPTPGARVAQLFLRVETLPDHEKVHQRLMDAARAAARDPGKYTASAAAVLADVDEESPALKPRTRG